MLIHLKSCVDPEEPPDDIMKQVNAMIHDFSEGPASFGKNLLRGLHQGYLLKRGNRSSPILKIGPYVAVDKSPKPSVEIIVAVSFCGV